MKEITPHSLFARENHGLFLRSRIVIGAWNRMSRTKLGQIWGNPYTILFFLALMDVFPGELIVTCPWGRSVCSSLRAFWRRHLENVNNLFTRPLEFSSGSRETRESRESHSGHEHLNESNSTKAKAAHHVIQLLIMFLPQTWILNALIFLCLHSCISKIRKRTRCREFNKAWIVSFSSCGIWDEVVENNKTWV